MRPPFMILHLKNLKRPVSLENFIISLLMKCAALLTLFFTLSGVPVFGHAIQSLPEPRREQLLNGLKILLWNRPGEAQVMLKLRIQSGAAFDLEGKAGLMTLLGDGLFPDPAVRRYVTEDLEGRLEVNTDYDAINVTLTGRAEEFERLVELLRNALVSPQLSSEVVARLREARIKTAREIGLAPEMIADRATAVRLYGTHPYGRVINGTPETLAKIDRPDLLLARERFMSPNNATLVCVGGVEPSRALRTFRQFLGVWRRSERIVPSTFRQPSAPDPRTLIVDQPGAPDAAVRLAARGLARTDRDLPSAMLLAALVRERLRASVPELKESALSVQHDAYSTGGTFRISAAVRSTASVAGTLDSMRKVLQSLVSTPPSVTELENAKRDQIAILSQGLEKPEAIAEAWLDGETYAAASIGDLPRAINALRPEDVQRVAARLFRDTPLATVAVGDATKLRAELARAGDVEVLGAGAIQEAKPAPATNQPHPPSLPLKRP